MIYIIYVLSIFIFITAFVVVYISLKRHERNIALSTSTKLYTASGVTYKLIVKNMSEIIFQLYLIIFVSLELTQSTHSFYCFTVFVYVLPLNTLITYGVHMLQKYA